MKTLLALFTTLFAMNSFAGQLSENEFKTLENTLRLASEDLEWTCTGSVDSEFSDVNFGDFKNGTVNKTKIATTYTLTHKHEETNTVHVVKYVLSNKTGKMIFGSREVFTPVRFVDKNFSEVESQTRYMSIASQECKPQ